MTESVSVDTPGGDSYETYVLDVSSRGEPAMPYDMWRLTREIMSSCRQYAPGGGWSSPGTKFDADAVKSKHEVQD